MESASPTEDIDALKSNHEEADTRMILHAAYAVRDSPTSAIVIQSTDTDVLALCLSHLTGIGYKNLWFRTRVSDRQRYITVHSIQEKLGEKDCGNLFQDFMPSLAAIRKVAYLVTGRRNHGLSCRAAPPTRQFLSCLDSGQTCMSIFLKAPRLSFVIYTPKDEDKRVPWTR